MTGIYRCEVGYEGKRFKMAGRWAQKELDTDVTTSIRIVVESLTQNAWRLENLVYASDRRAKGGWIRGCGGQLVSLSS